MKKITILALLILFTQIGFSQEDKYSLDFGAKFGLNNSKITTDRSQFSSETINNYHFGIYARLLMGRVYIQPEAYFISKGGDIKDILDPNPLQTISSFDYNSFDLPVLLGVKVIDKDAFNFRAMAGPVFSISTKRNVDAGNSTPVFSKEFMKDNFFGWQFGAGIDFLFLTFDARVERSFGHVYDGPNLESKSNTFLLSLGLKL